MRYAIEGWPMFANDAEGLWQRMWAEKGEKLKQTPGQDRIEPAVDMYDKLDRFGKLILVTVRDGKKLVGYTSTILQRHMHFPHTIGIEDSTYLDKDYRKGLTGVKLFRETESFLKRLGIQRYYAQVNEETEVIFKRLGFSPTNAIWSKWIGD